jgi:hypothetical protein
MCFSAVIHHLRIARRILKEYLAENQGNAGFKICSKKSGLQENISPLAWVMT